MATKDVHFSREASQPNVRIFCTSKWDRAEEDVSEGVYATERGVMYTFTPQRVTCEVCAVAASVDAMRRALKNVLALSHRIAKTDPESASHLRRFCESAGIVPEVMRLASPESGKE